MGNIDDSGIERLFVMIPSIPPVLWIEYVNWLDMELLRASSGIRAITEYSSKSKRTEKAEQKNKHVLSRTWRNQIVENFPLYEMKI